MFKLFGRYELSRDVLFFFLGILTIVLNVTCIVFLIPDKFFQIIIHFMFVWVGIELCRKAINMD